MPRYFFVVKTRLQRLNDEAGTTLLNDEKALAYARKLVANLKTQGDRDGWSMIVEDDGGRVVSTIPV